jgi:rfaE bifunctional protein kinase chain/domain
MGEAEGRFLNRGGEITMHIPIERFKEIIDRFKETRLAVFGDIVADIYIYGKPLRLSREAPVLVVRHDGECILPGSAGNTICNLSRLGVRVFPLGVIGDDEPGLSLVDQFSTMNVDMEGLLVLENRRTVTKTRIMAGDDNTSKQQVIRIDRDPREPLSESAEDRLLALLNRTADRVDGIIVSDYGYDLLTPAILEQLKTLAAHKTVVADSRFRLHQFDRLTVITPNEDEAEAVGLERIAGTEDAIRVGERILEKLQLKAILITRGNKGMVLVEGAGRATEIPICGSDEITDVTGAGDTVTAVLTASLAAGASFYEAARLSNYGGAVVVMKRGTATVSPGELLHVIEQDYEAAQ